MVNNEEIVIQALDNFLNDFIDRVFELSQENLVNDGKIDTGMLLKSGNVIREPLKKSIVYSANYADNVEFGRAAGTFPPIEPLQKWAERKLGISSKESRQVAWAIAKAIQERGIQASPFLEPAINQAITEYGA